MIYSHQIKNLLPICSVEPACKGSVLRSPSFCLSDIDGCRLKSLLSKSHLADKPMYYISPLSANLPLEKEDLYHMFSSD